MRSVSRFSEIAASNNLPFTYMPMSAVKAAVGLSRSGIYARIAAGEFPKGDLIGHVTRRWKSTDIANWLHDQAAAAEAREALATSRPQLRKKSQPNEAAA